MSKDMAAHVIMEGASDEVRELTRRLVEAIRAIADGEPARDASEACTRALALVNVVCAKPHHSAEILANSAGLFTHFSNQIAIRRGALH